LRSVLSRRTRGLLLFGSSTIEEHWAIDLVTASLALTDHAGPVARIMARKRRSSAKYWDVPDPIKRLPFLPSVQSAYEQGYRRMIVEPSLTHGDVIREYADKALLIAGTHGGTADEAFTQLLGYVGFHKENETLARTVAILGVTPARAKSGIIPIPDLFFLDENRELPSLKRADLHALIAQERVLKAEDFLAQLRRSGAITAKDLATARRGDTETPVASTTPQSLQ
jgi:hypothetical protein